MESLDNLTDIWMLLFIGGAIVLALILSGDKVTPAPQQNGVTAPVYTYSYEDNSTNVCVGWCPGGSR